MIASAQENRFLTLLVASRARPNSLNPIQSMHTLLNDLKEFAKEGDIQGWQESRGELNELLAKLNLNSLKMAEIQIEIRKLELTLLLKAGYRAMEQGEEAHKNASCAALSGETLDAQEQVAKAKKHTSFGRHLHAQLFEKTVMEILD